MDKASMYLMMKSEPEDSAGIQQDAESFQASLDDILSRLHALQVGPMGLTTAEKHVRNDFKMMSLTNIRLENKA